jgi:hypothetical protein
MLNRALASVAVGLVAMAACGCGGGTSSKAEKGARFVVNPTTGATTRGGSVGAGESEVVVAVPDGTKLTTAEARSIVEQDTGFVNQHCPCIYELTGDHVRLLQERHH